MSVAATLELRADVVEVLEGNPDSASAANRTVNHTLFNVAKSLDGTTTPAINMGSLYKLTLSGGAATIDLTAIPGANGITQNGTGKKPRYVRVRNLGANPMTFKEGASNGHPLFSGTGQTVPAGGSFAIYLPDSTAVAAGDRTWDVTGTGSEQAEVTILLG